MSKKATTSHAKLFAVSFAVLMIISASIVLFDDAEETDGYDSFGTAWIATSRSDVTGTKIADTDTLNGNANSRLTLYYGVDDYAMTLFFVTPQKRVDSEVHVQTSGSGASYELLSNEYSTNIGGTTYYIYPFVLTATSSSGDYDISLRAQANWLDGNPTAVVKLTMKAAPALYIRADTGFTSVTVDDTTFGQSKTVTTTTDTLAFRFIPNESVLTLSCVTQTNYGFTAWLYNDGSSSLDDILAYGGDNQRYEHVLATWTNSVYIHPQATYHETYTLTISGVNTASVTARNTTQGTSATASNSATATLTYSLGDTISLSAVAKANYQVAKYQAFVGAVVTNPTWNDIKIGTTYTFNASATTPTQIRAVAEGVNYTIYFNPGEGATVGTSSMTVKYGDTYPELPTPTWGGLTFYGWFTEPVAGTKISQGDTVRITHDTTLYAHWDTVYVTVNFDANGGSVSPTSKTILWLNPYGTLPTPTKTGYSFAGWFTDPDGGTRVYSTTTVGQSATHTLYAHWNVSGYTVTLNANGGSVSPSSIIVNYGDTYGDLPTPTRMGHTFMGWYTQLNGQGTRIYSNTTFMGSSDQTLYAYWTTAAPTVYFNPQGGTVSPTSKTITWGEFYGDLPTPTWGANEFLGWYTQSNGGTLVTASTEVTTTASHTLYAHWNVATFTVTLNANGGTVSPGYVSVSYGSNYGLLPTPTYDGYVFAGWWTAEEGGTRIQTDTTVTIEDDITLYAHWIVPTYDVLFNPQGGTVFPTHISVTYGQPYGTLPTPTYENMKFLGWYTEAEGGTRVYPNDIVLITANQTLYAHWVYQPVTGDAWWDNGYVNGRVSIAFAYDAANNATHTMTIPLVQYDGIKDDSDGLNDFTETNYMLKIVMVSEPRLSVTATLYDGTTPLMTETKTLGTWPAVVVMIDAQKSTIDVAQVRTPIGNSTFNFTSFSLLPETHIMDYSDVLSEGMAISKIYHTDSSAANHPHFQVTATTTYLDTYGFVMTDPSLNIYNQFPNYDDLRLNLYAFAIYGSTMSVNGHTFHLDGSVITDLYYTQTKDANGNLSNYIASPGLAGAIHKEVVLKNIYVTWENISSTPQERQCSITFVDDNLTLILGSFAPVDLTISFEGIWYFTTALWEPYSATETTYAMDWDSPFNISTDAFLLILIGLMIAITLVANVYYRIGIIDYAVIIAGGILAYIFIGAF